MSRISCCILVVVLSVLESNLGFLAHSGSARLRSIRLQIDSEAIVEVITRVNVDFMNMDSKKYLCI
jgi:hypothetical protein